MKQIDGASGATTKDLANMLNETFLSPISGFVLLPSDFLCSFNESMTTDAVLTVTTESVFEKLSKLNPNKVHGPDGIYHRGC